LALNNNQDVSHSRQAYITIHGGDNEGQHVKVQRSWNGGKWLSTKP